MELDTLEEMNILCDQLMYCNFLFQICAVNEVRIIAICSETYVKKREKKKKVGNQLLQLCMARTAWSDSVTRSASVIKLVLVHFGKCTILVVTKC